MGIVTNEQKGLRMMAAMAWSRNPKQLMEKFTDEEASTVFTRTWPEWPPELREKMKPFMGEAIRLADEAASRNPPNAF